MKKTFIVLAVVLMTLSACTTPQKSCCGGKDGMCSMKKHEAMK